MAFNSSSGRIGEALLQANLHWQKQRQAGVREGPEAAKAFTIAISRQAGAQGSRIAQIIGERLGWPVYDRELLQKIAEEKGLRVQLLESVDERHMNWLRECVESFLAISPLSEEAYVHYLVKTLLSLAALGECVIMGRGAAQILPAGRTFRVRLLAPRKERIVVIRRKLALSEEEAARWVERTDRERTQFVREHFHKDPADPSNYDLILNTGRFAPQAAADLIIQGLRQLQHNATAPCGVTEVGSHPHTE